MDVTCPACGAGYRVPDGLIGPQGRRVSCSSCGHLWHARDTSPGRGERREQLSEINRMIAVVQAEGLKARAAAGGPASVPDGHEGAPASVDVPSKPEPSEPAEVATTAEPEVSIPAAESAAPENAAPENAAPEAMQDPVSSGARAQAPAADTSQKAPSRGGEPVPGAGAFLAGFLVAAVLTSVLIAIYLLREQIVVWLPASEPAVTAYAATVDQARAAIAAWIAGFGTGA